MTSTPLVLGAVAYDPKVVTIWDGFRSWFTRRGFPFDYVLFSNYERQVAALVAGTVHVAWNSPLAWLQTKELAARAGRVSRALAMRDADRDLTSVVVALPGSGITSAEGLRGRRIATGASDSPQATLIPLQALRSAGLQPGQDAEVIRFEVGTGLHGDHVGGERDAARALADGRADVACMLDANHLQFAREGTLPPGTRIVLQTAPYDHCNFTALAGAPEESLAVFTGLLLSMSLDDPEVRPLLEMEGLRAWKPGRTTGYDQLEAALRDGALLEPFLDAVEACR